MNPQALLDQFLGTGQSQSGAPGGGGSGLTGSFGGGALAGGALGLLLGSKGGRKMGKKALKYGGLAVLGGLAYKAYRDYQAGQRPATAQTARDPGTDVEENARAAEGTAFLPPAEEERSTLAMGILRAMINAAKADGHIDSVEQDRIFGQIDTMALDTDAKAWVMDELRRPMDIDAVVSAARTPEQAAELYAASRLAIEPDSPAERGYLDMLAARLGLEADLVAHLNAQVEGVSAKA